MWVKPYFPLLGSHSLRLMHALFLLQPQRSICQLTQAAVNSFIHHSFHFPGKGITTRGISVLTFKAGRQGWAAENITHSWGKGRKGMGCEQRG